MIVFSQKAGTAYIERKLPKRKPVAGGKVLRPRAHFDKKQRRLFDSLTKQHYHDLESDLDGNDRVNWGAIFNGQDIRAADKFFDEVYAMYKSKLQEILNGVAADGAAGGAASGAAGGVDPNVLGSSDDELDD